MTVEEILIFALFRVRRGEPLTTALSYPEDKDTWLAAVKLFIMSLPGDLGIVPLGMIPQPVIAESLERAIKRARDGAD